jgi:uncharacterized protein
MKIKVREIVSGGLEYEDQVKPGDIGLTEEFIDLEKPLRIKGRLERVNEFVLVNLDVIYTADIVCARCLEVKHGEVTGHYEFDIEFKPGDEFINLGERIREEVLLGHPTRTLCREDCKGICPDCGAYLNEEECQCQKNKNNKE